MFYLRDPILSSLRSQHGFRSGHPILRKVGFRGFGTKKTERGSSKGGRHPKNKIATKVLLKRDTPDLRQFDSKFDPTSILGDPRRLEFYDSSQLIECIKSAGGMRLPEPSFWVKVTSAVLDVSSSLTSTESIELLWVFATMNKLNRNLVDALLRNIMVDLPKLKTEKVITLLSTLKESHYNRDRAVFAVLSEVSNPSSLFIICIMKRSALWNRLYIRSHSDPPCNDFPFFIYYFRFYKFTFFWFVFSTNF